MDIKKGDTVVCINNTNTDQTVYFKMYGIYTVVDLFSEIGIVVMLNGLRTAVNKNRFILLEEFRRNKINNIKKRIDETNISNS